MRESNNWAIIDVLDNFEIKITNVRLIIRIIVVADESEIISVTSNSWIEVQLHRALQLLDDVLKNLSNNVNGQQQQQALIQPQQIAQQMEWLTHK